MSNVTPITGGKDKPTQKYVITSIRISFVDRSREDAVHTDPYGYVPDPSGGAITVYESPKKGITYLSEQVFSIEIDGDYEDVIDGAEQPTEIH